MQSRRGTPEVGEHYSKVVVVLSIAVAFTGSFIFKWPFISTQDKQVLNGEAPSTSPMAGKTFVLVGAGGARSALAFEARDAVSGEALPYECLERFSPEKSMFSCFKDHPRAYALVFYAVYTPRKTWLLQEAVEIEATVVSGVEMFIKLALRQFRLFTGCLAPEDFMRKLVLEQF